MHVAGPSLQARRAGVLTTNTNRDDEVSGHIIGPFIHWRRVGGCSGRGGESISMFLFLISFRESFHNKVRHHASIHIA